MYSRITSSCWVYHSEHPQEGLQVQHKTQYNRYKQNDACSVARKAESPDDSWTSGHTLCCRQCILHSTPGTFRQGTCQHSCEAYYACETNHASKPDALDCQLVQRESCVKVCSKTMIGHAVTQHSSKNVLTRLKQRMPHGS